MKNWIISISIVVTTMVVLVVLPILKIVLPAMIFVGCFVLFAAYLVTEAIKEMLDNL